MGKYCPEEICRPFMIKAASCAISCELACACERILRTKLDSTLTLLAGMASLCYAMTTLGATALQNFYSCAALYALRLPTSTHQT